MNSEPSPINWPHCVGQQRIKEVLGAAVSGGTLGHAYLFSGEAGCGKFAAALDVAFILLCEGSGPARPCMRCASCKKVLHYAHPDFHVIMPVVLAKEHKGDGGELKPEGWEYISGLVKERIKRGYGLPDYSKVPAIPVDWVREVNHTILRGAVERVANVVVIDGIDSLNKEAANSLLKILEEPPRGTVMLLATDRISAVLPTIVSRCQIVRFSFLSPQEISGELSRRRSVDPSDPRLETVIHTGSLGRSLYLWDNPCEEIIREARRFWEFCMKQDWLELAPLIDALGEWNDYAMYERLFLEIIQSVRNALLRELPGTENVFLGQRSATMDLEGVRTPRQAEELFTLCQRSISAVRAHAMITLVLTNFAIGIMEALHGKEQQAC